MDYALRPLRRYFQITGRARRREFWLFLVLVSVVSIVLGIVDQMLGFGGSYQQQLIRSAGYAEYSGAYTGGILAGLWGLFVLIPSFTVLVRRLHDTDRSGFWMLLYLIPLIGAIVILVFTLLDGTSGPNRFGPDPKSGLDR